MTIFVICGVPETPNYVHAVYIAQYLQKYLPQFKYQTIEIESYDWTGYLTMLNLSNKWQMKSSPVIWKQLTETDNQKHLIGQLSEFWEYCYDYYGVESFLTTEDVQKLVTISIRNSQETKEEAEKKLKGSYVVGIVGTKNNITPTILKEVLQMKELRRENNGLIIYLYDEIITKEHEQFLQELIRKFISNLDFDDCPIIRIVKRLETFLGTVDLILFFENFHNYRLSFKNLNDWLPTLVSRMNYFATVSDEYAKPQLRVIFSCAEVSCLLAHILIHSTIKVKPYNVVCVTSDQSLQYLQAIKQVCNVPLESLSASPVWGFTSMGMFVDFRSTFFKTDVLKTFRRALTAPKGGTLPLGSISTQFRYLSYLIEDETQIERLIRRENELDGNKVEALLSLLRLWYGEEHDSIISLGVCSDGTNGIPEGLFFSQPVHLESKRRWRPFKEFPMRETTRKRVDELVENVVSFLKAENLF